MDDFDLFDDDLTVAEATLLVAAIDDEDGGRADRGRRRPAGSREAAAGRGAAASERRRAGGCAGCGCLLAVAGLGAFALPIAYGVAAAVRLAVLLAQAP